VSGIVYLVGGGPGDPRLLTLRGAEVLRTADVVVYDRLAPAALLDLAPARAELVDAGKAPGRASPSQDAINALMVSRAKAGRTVVRLKGGDPFVFGRGGEEALACARAAVACEVVPGVSAAIAGPASAGIPVTHRGLGTTFAVVTATASGGAGPDLRRVATAVDTLVVLMAGNRVDEVCEELVAAGRDPEEPAALVQWATTPAQRSVVSSVRDLPQVSKRHGLGPPAVLVVGRVVGLAHAAEWLAAPPLDRALSSS